MENDNNVNTVKTKIDSGVYVKVNSTNRGNIWEKFYIIKDSISERNTQFVMCKNCEKIYKYVVTSGTSHLSRHACGPISTRTGSNVSTTISAEDKRIVLKYCVRYCARDLRAFNALTGPGFKDLLQVIINITRKYGNISVENCLPHPTTVSRHILEEVEELKKSILPEIIQAIESECCAATTDFWSDKHTKTSFYTVTVHYINKEWKLINRILFTTEFPDKSKTGENIKHELCRRFVEFGVPNHILKKITFVTDQGSNIIKALEDFERLNCTAHLINCSLKRAFNDESVSDDVKSTLKVLDETKTIVSYLKRSGHASRLPNTVHQESETRWNSKINMLRSVVNQYDNITELLQEVNEIRRIENFSIEDARMFVEFLKPFEEAITVLQGEKSPTLHLVLLWVHQLLQHCEAKEDDVPAIKHVKSEITEYLKKKFLAHKYHQIALFLMPTFRRVRMLTEEEKIQLLKNIEEMIEHQIGAEATPSTSQLHQEPPAKRLQTVFHQWVDPEEDTANSEIQLYNNMPPMKDDDVLHWWSLKTDIFPNLQKLAKKVFAIPATSASSERCFSAAGFIMQERRSRLKPETLDGILFLHSNLPPEDEL